MSAAKHAVEPMTRRVIVRKWQDTEEIPLREGETSKRWKSVGPRRASVEVRVPYWVARATVRALVTLKVWR